MEFGSQSRFRILPERVVLPWLVQPPHSACHTGTT
jgi:hypothetical protein